MHLAVCAAALSLALTAGTDGGGALTTTNAVVTQPTDTAPAVTVTTIAESNVSGALMGISPAGVLAIGQPSGALAEVPLDEVVAADFGQTVNAPPAEEQGTLYLRGIHGPGVQASGKKDTDAVRGRVVASDKTSVTFESALLGRIALPFTALQGYVPPRQGGPGGSTAAVVEEVLASTADEDLVSLANGDRMAGVIESITAEQVVMSSKIGRAEYPMKDVTGIAFAHDAAARTTRPAADVPYVILTLVDGSTVSTTLTGMASAEGRRSLIRGQALAGFPIECQVKVISRFVVRNGRLVYLEDFDTAKPPVTVPFYNRVWPMRRGLSVWGRPLTIRAQTWPHGLGIGPRTTLTYALDARFDSFEGLAGIDDETEGKGKAQLTITLDGKVALNTTLAGGQAAVPIKLSVAGAKQMVVTIDFGPDDDAGDHVDLVNTRLIRKR